MPDPTTAPRCECPGCERGATATLAGVLVCADCGQRIQRARDRQTAGVPAVALAMMPPLTRTQVIGLANGGRRRRKG